MKNLSLTIRACLLTLGLACLVACGQKGPLILEQVPTDKLQQPLESTPDEVPVVSEEEAAAENE